MLQNRFLLASHHENTVKYRIFLSTRIMQEKNKPTSYKKKKTNQFIYLVFQVKQRPAFISV